MQHCVVYGGGDNDTINVKSTGSGKTGNLIYGGTGHDIINVYYAPGSTLVLDAREYFTEDRDILNIYADSSDLSSLKYYKKSDVMEINGNAHILGFSKLLIPRSISIIQVIEVTSGFGGCLFLYHFNRVNIHQRTPTFCILKKW